MQPNLDISIILPSYNEGKCLPNSVEKIYYCLRTITDSFEIIISDDGSSDNTLSFDWAWYKKERNVLYLRSESNYGKGKALRKGFSIAKGNVILFMDADLPIDLSAIVEVIAILRSGTVDVVYGDRKLMLSIIIGSGTLRRRISSKVVNLFVQQVLLPNVHDTQCPLKGFNYSALKAINEMAVIDGYSTDIELLYLAIKQKMKMQNIPVKWYDLRAKPSLPVVLKTVLLFYRDIVLIKVWRYPLTQKN